MEGTKIDKARHQWDLSRLYPTHSDWERDVSALQNQMSEVATIQGKGTEPSTLFDALQLQSQLESRFEKVYTYAYLRHCENMADDQKQACYEQVIAVANELYGLYTFLSTEIGAIQPEQLHVWFEEDPRLIVYRKYLEDVRNEGKHVMSQDVEELLTTFGEVIEGPSSIFSMLIHADLRFEGASDREGHVHEVTNSTYFSLLMSQDRELRKNAFQSLLGTYGRFKNVLGTTLGLHIKSNVAQAQIRNFPSALEMALHEEQLFKTSYEHLVTEVRQHSHLLHRLMSLRKRVMAVEELHWYDLFTSIVEDFHYEIPFDLAKERLLEALQPLGDVYMEIVKQGYREKWVDADPAEHKHQGAFCMSSYESNPFVLLSYRNSLDDLCTFAHEMGHAVHAVFSNRAQPFVYSKPTTLIGEIAALVNEHLVVEHLLRSETCSPLEKLYLLTHSLEQFRGKVFRQIMNADFEKMAHERVEDGEVLTADTLRELYAELMKMYYGPELVLDDEVKNECLRIPHFYQSFYVYKYVFGFLIATEIAFKILAGERAMVERYKELLQSGSSATPQELLEQVGVDLGSGRYVEQAFRLFEDRLNEIECFLADNFYI